ncbi:hypothetical protein COW64_08435 [bacterium (Candidatus Blackallbacteria) CG18_big_fil_WC_8_21_14_2_50_49_26]|nr:MAG: hypothetical protein COW64_08435 [bacterium (Candidatus Blackallbacteria) CG18_big_fil_WC_8_21_14_2_50_49_26]
MAKHASRKQFVFSPIEFLLQTTGMSAEAIGGYIVLLCHQWDKGPLLESRARFLCYEIGVGDGAFEEISQHFILEGGRMWNPQMEAHLSSIKEEKKPVAEVTLTAKQEVWEAYSTAYNIRYGVEPIRNAKVNAQIKSLVTRVGRNLAVQIAKMYCEHNDQFYVLKLHPVGLMLADAEKLATEFRTGKKMTPLEARGLQRRDSFRQQVERIAKRTGG